MFLARTRDELLEMFDGSIKLLGKTRMVEEMFNGLSDEELEEYRAYIAGNHDLSYSCEK